MNIVGKIEIINPLQVAFDEADGALSAHALSVVFDKIGREIQAQNPPMSSTNPSNSSSPKLLDTLFENNLREQEHHPHQI